jgi:hypothetical protein
VTRALLLLAFLIPTQAFAQQARGFLAGRVLERESGRPLDFANIVVVGTEARAQADLDGRFRFPIAAGVYSVRVTRIGNAPTQIDSVRIVAGETTTINVALGAAVIRLTGIAVTATAVQQASEDALLLAQKSAPRVSDGISAEAIRRAPGADAGDAIVRVTGVSVVDGKFAVVRGLAERYSNTLLNGVELPSPEPLKKIVPLDLFPSSLLESIVVSKTATPDRPGDFAGGSVEVTTKEFPASRVFEANIASGYGSVATFQDIPRLRQRGIDFLGFDAGNRRQMPTEIPTGDPFSPLNEPFSERLRNEWTPTPSAVPPNFDAGLSFGGRAGGDAAPFGYAVALSYGRGTEANPARLAQLVFDADRGVPDQGYISREATTTTDLAAIGNFALQLGPGSKISLKNLYTRNSEELLSRSSGYETYNGLAERVIYQARFISRQLIQTQLTGDHALRPLFRSRFEWKATASWAGRDEPENRSLIYFRQPGTGDLTLSPSSPSPFWFRFLRDRVLTGQADWSIPLTAFMPAGSQFKVGALGRTRDRSFDAYHFRLWANRQEDGTSGVNLPPEQAFSPELLGSGVSLRREGEASLPYESDDDVNAAYVMVDLPLTHWLRITGGTRREQWQLALYQGTRAAPIGDPTRRKTSDDLWSGNITFSLSDRQNIRLAGYRTVARPDPRELAPDYYIAITGDCANQGNPLLQSTRIINADLRWEYFPRPGELFSISAFAKDFTAPIGELLTYPGSSLCTVGYVNLDFATIRGAEFELRRALDFLPGPFSRLGFGLNVTAVRSASEITGGPDLVLKYPLQGQSDLLANVNLLYLNPESGFEASLLANYFSDRVIRYGISSLIDGRAVQVPNVMEQGRIGVDAKLRRKVGRASISLSARNLLDAEVIYYQTSTIGRTRTGYVRPGVSVNLGIGYAFR